LLLTPSNDRWSLVYERAIREDGSLYFPERLTKDFLDQARKTMGSYFFSNQYQNEIIPDDERRFRKEWLRYTTEMPQVKTAFGFIDPAIGQREHSDYTGIAVIYADLDGVWYLRLAARYRLTPTQIVNKAFELCEQFNLAALGVESVAYQEALLYLMAEEMNKRQKTIPVKGIPRTRISKESRILGLVPRFEWGRILCFPGMTEFEDEYHSFPRGTHDDILDALASLEELVYYPVKENKKLEQPHSPHHPDYEKWYIQQLVEKSNGEPRVQGNDSSFL
jgi:phage terminase large subunit-like protein